MEQDYINFLKVGEGLPAKQGLKPANALEEAPTGSGLARVFQQNKD